MARLEQQTGLRFISSFQTAGEWFSPNKAGHLRCLVHSVNGHRIVRSGSFEIASEGRNSVVAVGPAIDQKLCPSNGQGNRKCVSMSVVVKGNHPQRPMIKRKE